MDAHAPTMIPTAAAAAAANKNKAFAKLAIRKSSAADAMLAEDDGHNPWTRAPRERTPEYFKLLEMRRGLPVAKTRAEFIDTYIKEQVIVYVGETGSGKTTQIPQFVMYADLPQDGGKKIVCTQPRRLAAREVATRVAHELDVELGEEVGYQFRNETVVGPRTRMVYTTDGRLVQEFGRDPNLSRYSCIIIDEAHERSESIDMLLGLIQPVLKRRRDLKLIIISATLDVDTFQRCFPQCKTFTTEGRTFGYQLSYGNWGGLLTSVDFVVTIVATVKAIVKKRVGEDIHSNNGGMGDILVFVPGEDDIKRAMSGIQSAVPGVRVFGLHGSMSKKEQQLSLAPVNGFIKVIVATNVAETSLTIDGVVHVIDSGLTKGMSYNPRLNIWTLAVEPISQAAALERAGRSGRTRPGFCWRLYSEEAYQKLLLKKPLPQILRGDLMGTLLDLVALGRVAGPNSVRDFPFVDPPSMEVVLRGWSALQSLGCLDERGQITQAGRMARILPVEPRHAMAIVQANASRPVRPVWEIAAIMSLLNEDGVVPRPGHMACHVDAVREAWGSPQGDHFSLLNIWHDYMKQVRQCEGMAEAEADQHMEEWCEGNFLNDTKLRAARATFESIMSWSKRELNFAPEPAPASKRGTLWYQQVIMKALLSAGFVQIAVRDPSDAGTAVYRTLEENQPGTIHPASIVSRGFKHDFVMYDRFLDQGRPYFMDVTGIDPDRLFEDAHLSSYVDRLLGDERIPRSDKFCSLKRLELARSDYLSGRKSEST